ncbi:very-long-chain (3R)-3-hydroxyacyl-CoA dehydratase Phs1p [[Candida] anglica]|uniref:Very-long-chain (3R)-3-hydroxyacyl-CoA dehydratase n=1 Tax=[Candida] anglica TaxID=148631 RepID=A0ABP0ELU6_9ASCO
MRYLEVYNGVSMYLWARLLGCTLLDVWGYLWMNPNTIYVSWTYQGYPHKFFVVLQTITVLFELIHWFMGLVPSSISTLLVHASGRLMIALAISFYLPDSRANFSPVYALLLIVWSTADITRYSVYLGKQLQIMPALLERWRYSMFIPLYPIALVSSMYLIYLSLNDDTGFYFGFLLASSTFYGCGYLWVFTHMWEKRLRWIRRVEQLKEFDCEKSAILGV